MIAYFSMEIAVDAQVPTYAGGLGVLAGDMVRAAADLGFPFIAVTLLHRDGYFRQRLDQAGRQHEEAVRWNVEGVLEPLAPRITVTIEGRSVIVRAWRCLVRGSVAAVPVVFLDTDLDDNTPGDRALSHGMYGGDERYRLAQEIVLGIGGVRMLRALGLTAIQTFHLNEGHSALLIMELLAERVGAGGRTTVTDEDVDSVRRMCVFTTHTPVPAALDQFTPEMAERTLGPSPMSQLMHRCCYNGALNLTYLALTFSHYVNGVAMRHAQVSRQMFGGYRVDAITNGVHAATWVSPPFATLFDRDIPGWRRDNFALRYAISLPRSDVWDAHGAAKQRLLQLVNASQDLRFDPSVLTIGFARRATAYKRADLVIADVDRLRRIAAIGRGVQFVFGGKAHPRDDEGKRVIERLFQAREALRDSMAIAYLEDYNMAQAAVLTAGCDVWLNTPQPPLEASGTSGMKAALNGVPSLSVVDGWWVEGLIEGVTGWAIGEDRTRSPGQQANTAADAAALYDALERTVLPAFYGPPDPFIDVMRHAIALNGSFFTAQRMLREYLIKAYHVEEGNDDQALAQIPLTALTMSRQDTTSPTTLPMHQA
jgi:starch phosphorylase